MGLLHTVGFVLHPQRDSAEAIETLMDWARRTTVEVLGLHDEVARIDCSARPVSSAELSGRSDLVISLGGDGTMLRTMRLLTHDRPPILGVNLGRLGFLAEVDVADLAEALSHIDAHRFRVEQRTAVNAVLPDQDGGPPRTVWAFNDVALVRVPGRKMAAVGLRAEGHEFVRYAADALIVATPTGSTAYSFSAGGPIVSPNVEALIVTPASPHSAFNRSLVLAGGESLRLDVLSSSGELAVEVDGQVACYVGPGDTVELTAVSAAAQVVRLGGTTFYQRTQRKLGLTGSAEAT